MNTSTGRKSARAEDRKTPIVRLVIFQKQLFEPRANERGVLKYGCTLLFPKSADMTDFRRDAEKVALEMWGETKVKNLVAAGGLKSPFLDGDGPQAVNKKSGQRYEGFAGHTFLRVTANDKPKLYDRNVMPAGPDVIYSGCYGYAVINAFTWEDSRSGCGISFGISMFQFAKDGERLAGGEPDPEQFFERIADEGAAPAATKTGAGAGGLFG